MIHFASLVDDTVYIHTLNIVCCRICFATYYIIMIVILSTILCNRFAKELCVFLLNAGLVNHCWW